MGRLTNKQLDVLTGAIHDEVRAVRKEITQSDDFKAIQEEYYENHPAKEDLEAIEDLNKQIQDLQDARYQALKDLREEYKNKEVGFASHMNPETMNQRIKSWAHEKALNHFGVTYVHKRKIEQQLVIHGQEGTEGLMDKVLPQFLPDDHE